MRRLRWVLFLPLWVLLAQTGALLHELGHFRDAASVQQRDTGVPDDGGCQLCLAFSHVDQAASGTPWVAPVLKPTYATALAPAQSLACAAAPQPCSRGPPLTL